MGDTTRRKLTHYPAFSAPSAAVAYSGAPDLAHETEEVAKLARELEGPHRPEYYGPTTVAERRETALRTAALADRRWWQSRTEADAQLAEAAAYALQQYDRLHPEEVAGPIGPDSIEWDAPGGLRAYVRQEYLFWYSVPPGCGPCPPEDPCPWHAEHGTR
ncbi:hypothetical protein ACFY2K_42610 [Kitasatospora sp. NPDC001309]|uniref:hypothetical protein n=1 Tax=Kitasatospora sp. NPDC001309 TaxID=3364013 RepID=UPI003677FF74